MTMTMRPNKNQPDNSSGRQAAVARGRRTWYYQTMGEVHGPVSSRRMWKLAQARTIRPETFVRKGEHGAWHLAEQVQGLFDPAFARQDTFLEPETAPVVIDEATAVRETAQLLHRRQVLLAGFARRRWRRRLAEWGLALAGLAFTLGGLGTILLARGGLPQISWGSLEHLVALSLVTIGLLTSFVAAWLSAVAE